MRVLEFVSLTEDEKLLVTEGIELHQELLAKVADEPTPAGPTPRELEKNLPPEIQVIPLKTVRRSANNRERSALEKIREHFFNKVRCACWQPSGQ